MKAVILAGGKGTRISEETHLRPKPMIEIGGQPILWHIMKLYSSYGVNDFVVCLGYRGYVIKEYFANYLLHRSDVTFDLQNNRIEVHNCTSEPWKVTLVDTGEETMTGGRLRRARAYVKDEDAFCFTYGDAVADIDIGALIDFHRTSNKKATVTAVAPPARFGRMELEGDAVTRFAEKPRSDGGLINGGFFVLAPSAIDYVDHDMQPWEAEPMERLAADGQLAAWQHAGFWQCMDTLRDKTLLEELWREGAPWARWEQRAAA
ncbi:Glucose-1-phosphate cytidylyltransferase [Alphaproteobacteria bacterium SO-S41]|nr:Glucose-1-phosphate cytidylyltransferase [Alphaproteobacteria bacterium SO-S41]